MDKKVFIIAGVALLLLLTFAVFNKSRKPNYNWRESYKVKEKSPYGLHILKEVMNSYSTAGGIIDVDKKLEVLAIDSLQNLRNNNFVFIGQAIHFDSTAFDRLLAFVENGNTAFISSSSIPQDLMEQIYPQICYEYDWEDYETMTDTTVSVTLYHPQFPDSSEVNYYYGKEKKEYRWSYIYGDYFCDSIISLTELGLIDDTYVNFAKKEYGEGTFYLHTTPLAFTNYHMLDTMGLHYAENVFSHLDSGQIFWDETHKISAAVSRRKNRNYSGGGGNTANNKLISEGPLSYILSNKSLRAAWYTLLACAFFFLLFRTRRKQRVIPVLESNRNTSLDFISTIGSLYFMQNDHMKLTQQQGRLFLNYIRTHYDLPTQNLDDKFQERLVAKSNVSEEIISKILKLWSNLKDANFVSENSMVDFYKLLNQFYKNCK